MLILVSLAACTPSNVPEVSDEVVLASGATLQSEKTRIETPEVSGSEQNDMADGNGAFAFDLYQQLKTREGNLFYSPYSISAALAMTYAGASGITAEQMAAALHFDLPQNKLHSAFNRLDSELSRRGEGAGGKDGEGFQVDRLVIHRHFASGILGVDHLQRGYADSTDRPASSWVLNLEVIAPSKTR